MSSHGYEKCYSIEIHPILRIIDKYRYHASVKLIKPEITLKFLASYKETLEKSNYHIKILIPKRHRKK